MDLFYEIAISWGKDYIFQKKIKNSFFIFFQIFLFFIFFYKKKWLTTQWVVGQPLWRARGGHTTPGAIGSVPI
jgi:hypothetical protein